MPTTNTLATESQIRELAAVIAAQAEAISTGAVVGPAHAAALRVLDNARTLAAWTDSV